MDVAVKGAINTLDIAIKHNIKYYVLCSSSEVYNEPSTIPTPESERILIPDLHNPRFSYSGGKIISEQLTILYGAKRGLHTKIFRPHNIYGPNMGLEHVIPQIVKKIMIAKTSNTKTINIQGSGLETRAFCFIEDAVEQMIIASDHSSENGTVYNIGIEHEISIITLTNLIAEILDIQIDIHPDNNGPVGGTNRRCPDMTKLKNLGHVPKHTLYDGLKQTVEWYKNYYLNIERINE